MSYLFFFRYHELKHDPRIFLFLAIFPQNVVLRKRFLIYWWIGEGFVANEEEGERVFDELLDLELLMPCSSDKCQRVSKCQISSWARYLLISEANKEKLLMNVEVMVVLAAGGAAAPACKEGELGRRDGGEGEGELRPNNNYMILWD